jgi:signal transduction histidine kinase/ligand-binding sensor domain-containing protein/DNA-binding response OmpR family regulator
MRILGVWILLGVLLPGMSIAQNQSIRVQTLSDKNGLSNNQVTSIMQDADGFIWLATRDGLNRFDGFDFKVYQPRANNCNNFHQHNFNDALIDHTDTMWVKTACGLHQYDIAANMFSVSYLRNERVLSDRKIQSTYEDRQGQIWVGTNYGINKFNRSNNSFDYFLPYPSSERGDGKNIVGPIFDDQLGRLWLGSYLGGLSQFDPIAQTFSHFRHDPDDDRSLASDVVTYVYTDRSDTVWVGTTMGLQRLDRGTGTFDHFRYDPADRHSLSDNTVSFILEDREGTLWVGTRHGLNRFNSSNETFDRFLHNPADPYSLSGNFIRRIFEDRLGFLWVATQSAGVSRFNPRLQGFAYYNRNVVKPNGLTDSGVQAVYEDRQGRVWVGTSRGLHEYDPTTESFTAFLHDQMDGALTARRDDILSIYEDRSGTLWVGSRVGLSSFDRDRRAFRDFQPAQEINEFNANVILEDSFGVLWIGTTGGPIQFDREQQKFLNPRSDVTSPMNTALHSVQINFIHEDRDGDMWFGTDINLSQYHRKLKYFTHRGHSRVDPDNPESMSSDTALSIYEDAKGVFWIGTKNGLNKHTLTPHPQRPHLVVGTFVAYGAQHGIPGQSIVGILGDDDGFLWLSTDNGLARFDPVSETAVSFDVMDGLQGNVFSTGSHLRARDGRMFFGGSNGLTAFYPEQVKIAANDDAPAVVLTDLRFANYPVANGPALNYADELVLGSDDTMFSIGFAALAFDENGATQYAYKMTGVNSDWIITNSDDRRATYSGLSSGNYLFEVTRVDRSGNPDSQITSLRISILPPFWLTWWAYALYVLAASLAVFSLVQIRTLSLKRRAVSLEEVVAERTRQVRESEKVIRHQADHLEELLHVKEKFFANISHEFRTPLTLILGPVERLIKSTGDAKDSQLLRMVRSNSQRLLRLVDQLLGLSRLSSEEPLTKSAQPLRPVVESIVRSFQPLAQEKNITLDVVDCDGLWVLCSPDALEKILLNLVSNAIKYTPSGGWIKVQVTADGGDMVKLSVSDSGIGISSKYHDAVFERFYRIDDSGEASPGAGLGLALVKELTQSYGGSIELESNPGQGTTVSVLLPRQEVEPGEDMPLSPDVSSKFIPLEVATSSHRTAQSSGRGNGRGNGQESLLIVEDNLDMQEYLVSLLSDTYHCQVAANGESGVDLALESIPDLVLCDVMLPKMDGFMLSETLKTNELTSHIPIVLLTGRGDSDSRLKGLREHVDDYLTKPFSDEELSLRIANLLAARKAMKRKFSRLLFDGTEASSDMGAKDLQFLNKLQAILQRHHGDADFRMDRMSGEMAMSDRQLQRKLKAVTDRSPAEYLRGFRLHMAMKQLKQGKQVGLVAEAVGFSSSAYFASCFKAEFGATPSEFQQTFN